MALFLEKLDDISALGCIVKSLTGISEFESFRFCDNFANERKRYDVFKIVHNNGVFVLKQYGSLKRFEAEKAVYKLFAGSMPVPRLIGCTENCIAADFIEGSDLKHMTDDGARAAAISVSEIMNAFPFGFDYDRAACINEISYREKRLDCLVREPLLRAAYELFLDRLRSMPMTFGNGDFLPINCIYTGRRVYIIDWEYGGFMPYALDLGRFIAHAGESEPYPFYMNSDQKALFVNILYENLNEKPDRSVFERDISFAVLDECIMLLKAYFDDPNKTRDEDFNTYYSHALALAKYLL